MTGFINDYNFAELECQKYWAPPATWDKERKKTEVYNRIFSGEWYGSQKRDGALYVFVKDEDGNVTLRGRSKSVTGEYIDKWDHLPHLLDWAESIPNGSCFIGEVYWPGNEGSKNTTTVMNCLTEKAIERQVDDKNKMRYYIFDILAYDGLLFFDTPAADRFEMIETLSIIRAHQFVEYAHYYTGAALWSTLQTILGEGFEGIVITKGDSYYEPGKRPSKTTMKVKKELQQTIDCFFTGKTTKATFEYTGKEVEHWPYWINLVTGETFDVCKFNERKKGEPYSPITKGWYYGWAGSLEIGVLGFDGKSIVPIGYLSNVEEEIKANPAEYSMKPIEVTAMELDYSVYPPTLRHGRMLGFRTDLTVKDCTIDKI